MTLAWVDSTSYARDEKRVPRSFRAKLPGGDVVVTRHIYLQPTEWRVTFGSAVDLTIEGDVGIEDAKAMAEEAVREYVTRLAKALE